jgi:hypothetical protein
MEGGPARRQVDPTEVAVRLGGEVAAGQVVEADSWGQGRAGELTGVGEDDGVSGGRLTRRRRWERGGEAGRREMAVGPAPGRGS